MLGWDTHDYSVFSIAFNISALCVSLVFYHGVYVRLIRECSVSLCHFLGTTPHSLLCVPSHVYAFWSVSVSLCVSPAFEHCLLLWKALYQPARSAETLCSTQKISNSFVSNIMFSLGLYCTQRLVLHLNLFTRRVHRLLKTSY